MFVGSLYSAAAELSAAALESSFPAAELSSDTVEEVLLEVEPVLPELEEVSPEQAAMLATITKAIIATIIFFIMSFPFKMRFATASWLPSRDPAVSTRRIHGTKSKSNTLQRNHKILYKFLTSQGMIINKVFIIWLCRKPDILRVCGNG